MAAGEPELSFSHDELVEITGRTLNSLLEGDALLGDLPRDLALEEAAAQLALQHGQSMTVYLLKDNGEQIPVVVHLGGTLLDLKKALKRQFGIRMKRRDDDRTKISWKYIWRSNYLCFDGERLTDDNARLVELGIKNKTKLTFQKKFREKNVKKMPKKADMPKFSEDGSKRCR